MASKKLSPIAAPVLSVLMLTSNFARAENLVSNGSFEKSSFTTNHELNYKVPSGVNDSGVTGWDSDKYFDGGTTYNLWFDAATATTVDAVSQYTGHQRLDAAYGTTSAPDGTHFVALDGDFNARGFLHQTINNLISGHQYHLSFSWAAVQLSNQNGDTTERLQFVLGKINGQATETVQLKSQGFSGWMTGGGTFTAHRGSEDLSFIAIGNPTGHPSMVLLDKVSLNEVVSPNEVVPEPSSLGLSLLGMIGIVSLVLRRRLAS